MAVGARPLVFTISTNNCPALRSNVADAGGARISPKVILGG